VLGADLGSVASIFTIVVGIITLGGLGIGGGRWYMKRKEGPASDRVLLHRIDERLVGVDPTDLIPNPAPGLIEEIGDMKTKISSHTIRLGKLEIGQEEIMTALRPNGGQSQDPGDVLQRILLNQNVLMDHMGLTPTVPAPGIQHPVEKKKHG
jgi:hypothetical protein